MLSILQYFYTDDYTNTSMIIGRSIEVALLIIAAFIFRYIYKKSNYYPLINLIFILIYVVALSYMFNFSSIPADFIGLEILYIILIICHSTLSKILEKIVIIISIFIPWIILATINANMSIHLTNALLAAAFFLINLKALYSQEQNDRMNFNLEILSNKEIKENEDLLVQLIPPHVLENLKDDVVVTDKLHSVTLIYADIVGFTD